MQKTQHYQLNQWEPADGIERAAFNADNAAIDAALSAHDTAITDTNTQLAAVAAANCFVKLGAIVITTAGQSVDLDLSGVNMAEYNALFILASARLKGSNGTFYVRLNGTFTMACCSNSDSISAGLTMVLPMGSGVAGRSITTQLGLSSAGGITANNGGNATESFTWADLHTITFYGDSEAGATAVVYGLKG